VRLSDPFLAHAGAARDALAAAGELEQVLQDLVAGAHQAWPDVAVPDDDFVVHLAQRLPADGDPLTALAQTHAADLYLACACARGDAGAIRAFDEQFIAQVSSYLGRNDAMPGIADEVKQRLRARLLVRDGQVLPPIAAYTGRGPLGAWLRVIATREALRLHGSEAGVEAALADMAVPGATTDPELAYLKAHYAEDLSAAFAHTLAALEPREGAVLRLYYLEGMTADAIGLLYRVSSRTVQRWIADTREKVLADTHRRLAERLNLPPGELDGLLGLLQSQVEVSIWRFLDDVSRSRT
jgi:RNA polymerase sigma-70 factor (ECF subfamily)